MWINVNDSLPNNGRPVLMIYDAPARWVANVGFLANGVNWLTPDGKLTRLPIKYWMDIPEPPTIPNENGRSLYDCKYCPPNSENEEAETLLTTDPVQN